MTSWSVQGLGNWRVLVQFLLMQNLSNCLRVVNLKEKVRFHAQTKPATRRCMNNVPRPMKTLVVYQAQQPTHPPTHPKKRTPPPHGYLQFSQNQGETRQTHLPTLRSPPPRYSINQSLSYGLVPKASWYNHSHPS